MKRKSGRSTHGRPTTFTWHGFSARPIFVLFLFFCLLPPARASLPAALARSCEPCHSELAERAAVIGGVPVEERCCAGGRGTQRDSHSAPKRRLDDVCAPKRQRGTDIESVFAHGWLRSSAAFTR